MSTRRLITFEIPDQTLIPEVQAAVTHALDENAIVERVGGSGQVLTFRVRFAHDAEVAGLAHDAAIAALRVTSCEMRVGY